MKSQLEKVREQFGHAFLLKERKSMQRLNESVIKSPCRKYHPFEIQYNFIQIFDQR